MTEDIRPLEDAPDTPPAHDRRREPPGGYVYGEERKPYPDGWRELDRGEEQSPATQERPAEPPRGEHR